MIPFYAQRPVGYEKYEKKEISWTVKVELKSQRNILGGNYQRVFEISDRMERTNLTNHEESLFDDRISATIVPRECQKMTRLRYSQITDIIPYHDILQL